MRRKQPVKKSDSKKKRRSNSKSLRNLRKRKSLKKPRRLQLSLKNSRGYRKRQNRPLSRRS